MTGMDRLRQIELKVRIMSRRQLAAFLANEIQILPCSGDIMGEEIAREFERLLARANK